MSVLLTNSTTERKKRAISLDLARGAMLLLIVLAHAPYIYTTLNLESCKGRKV